MAVRPEGEFELVLGNRQLFSVLGIVVILLGIFFAMGFFAGKSVGQASANSTASQRQIDQASPVADAAQNSTTPASPSALPSQADFPTSTEKERAPKFEEQTADHETKAPSASKKPDAPAPKPAIIKAADQVVKPEAGSYLQVASTRLSEAQSLAALLRKHQFHVILAESPKADLIRVLVGPFSSSEATTLARAKLKSLDIAKPYPVKY